MHKTRICVIGAGPAGMSMLYHLAKMSKMPEVVCFEKQNTWGGQWNYTWKTGVDENGEPVHPSTYKSMWTNIPKEANEYYDYTFEQHFGKPTPSFLPVDVLRDYLEGRFTKGASLSHSLKEYIQFNTAVRLVEYSDEREEFTVFVNDYNKGCTRKETFSHVVVATGIFHTPNLPEIPGMKKFNGRILHSHDFRDAREFARQKVLVLGAGYSGEDIVLQCIKFGAKRVIFSYRTTPKSASCVLPDTVEEKPMVERFDSTRAYFKDGSSAEIDSVILSTGYRNCFPFLEDRFRIPEETSGYPEGLYKATLFYKSGNNRLFYIGALTQIYSFTYFEVMAKWICKYISKQLPGEPKTNEEMEADSKLWVERANSCKSEFEFLDFQTDLVQHLAELGGYNSLVVECKKIFFQILTNRRDKNLGLANCRNIGHRSVHTGVVAPTQTPFMQNYDSSIDAYVNCK